MVECELFLGNLRSQLCDLQSLVNYLENRDGVGYEEYSYSFARLQEVVKRLEELKKLSSRRGDANYLRAQWLN